MPLSIQLVNQKRELNLLLVFGRGAELGLSDQPGGTVSIGDGRVYKVASGQWTYTAALTVVCILARPESSDHKCQFPNGCRYQGWTLV